MKTSTLFTVVFGLFALGFAAYGVVENPSLRNPEAGIEYKMGLDKEMGLGVDSI